MNISLYIARRYLLSKKRKNAIHYITTVSVILVAFVTMSLIIAMSVFNGLTILITSMFSTFDPQIKVQSAYGRVFSADSAIHLIRQVPEVAYITPVLEEDILFVYADKQLVGKLKGVGEEYSKTCPIDSMILSGEFVLQQNGIEYISVGQGVAHSLSVGLQFRDVMHMYAPDRNKGSSINPLDDYNKEYAYARSVFSVQMDIDNAYVLSSLTLAQRLLEYQHNQVSAIELKCVNTSDYKKVANVLRQKLGGNYKVRDREQQHEFLYKITQSEKLITFLLVTLILIIASFSIAGALTMLIIDKKRDISILASLGAEQKLIQRIFIFEGWMISILGAVIGLCIGVCLVLVQQHFGILKLHGESSSFIVEAYPVHLQCADILYTVSMVLTVGFIAAYIPVRFIFKKHIHS